jgi:arabinofuranosyltransferase
VSDVAVPFMTTEADAGRSLTQARLRAALLLTVAALVLLAWTRRFVQDDAFISFRYAQHLARGQGPTWNVGEPPIQGFSNLLWTLAIAAAMRAGADPVATSYVLGLAAFAGTLVGTYALVRALGGSRAAAWTCLVWVGTNYTMSAYATGGLETQAHVCLLTWAACLSVDLVRGKGNATPATAKAVALSLIGGAALWLRLDSALPIAVLLGAVVLRRGVSLRQRAALVVPATVAFAALIGFDLHTFGSVLPNTYYAKADRIHPHVVEAGAEYVLAFLRHYGLLPHLVLCLVFLPRAVRSERALVVPVACVVSWTAYVVWVGGDFMEFRMIVPVMPMAFAVLAVMLFAFVPSHLLLVPIALTVVLESLVHQYDTYDESSLLEGVGIETIHGLTAHMEEPDQAWPEIGRVLRRAFGDDPRVTIAVGAAGAIPYYSELRTVDTFGLNDAWVARHGRIDSPRPGHRRTAPASYLVQRGVNLAIIDPADPEIPHDAAIVHVPVTPQCTAEFAYLVRSPVVDEVIRREGWVLTPLR